MCIVDKEDMVINVQQRPLYNPNTPSYKPTTIDRNQPYYQNHLIYLPRCNQFSLLFLFQQHSHAGWSELKSSHSPQVSFILAVGLYAAANELLDDMYVQQTQVLEQFNISVLTFIKSTITHYQLVLVKRRHTNTALSWHPLICSQLLFCRRSRSVDKPLISQ